MYKTFFIITSGDILSGGVSSMHNLCKGLIESGYDAKMVYLYANEELIKEKFAERFNVPRAWEIEDDERNVLIVPEILPQLFDKYTHIKKILYWLSLQFFFKSNNSYRWPLNIKLLRKPFYCNDFFSSSPGLIESLKLRVLYWGIRKSSVWGKDITQITNSYYTYSFCKIMGAEQVHLLHNPIINEVFAIKQGLRKNQILIGAKTSKLLVAFLKKFCAGYKIIRLKGISIEKVYELMSESLVFAEFGISNRDRTPREAATLGCIVFTSNGGSANYYEDVPIPDYYKLKDKILNFIKIRKRIVFAAKNYQKLISDFDHYREQVVEEKRTFSVRIGIIMEKILKA